MFMSQLINEITKWFEAQKGSTLTIHKRELSIGLQQIIDKDEVELKLEKIEINNNPQSQVDHYIAAQELALHGHGKLHTDNGLAELPRNVYKIPLTKNMTIRNDKNGLQLNTEKAEYSFEPLLIPTVI